MQLHAIFSNDKSHVEEDEMDIKLFGVNITESVNPTFLGIPFDKHLTFKNQLEYLA
jgi:hypothetical protein